MEDYKYEDQTWLECIRDLYSSQLLDSREPECSPLRTCVSCVRQVHGLKKRPTNTIQLRDDETSRTSFGTNYEDAIVTESSIEPENNNQPLDQQPEKKFCTVDYIVCHHRAKMFCTSCGHPERDHCTHLLYREAQFNHYTQALHHRNFEEMIRRTSAIARVSKGALRLQEKNLLSSSFYLYVNSLRSDWITAREKKKQGSERRDQLSRDIVRVSVTLLKLLDEKVFPYAYLDTILCWIRLKMRFQEFIMLVTQPNYVEDPSIHSDIYSDIRKVTLVELQHLRIVLEEVNTHHEILDIVDQTQWIHPAVTNGHVILPNDPILLRAAVAYGTYCDEVIHNPMRSWRIMTTALSEAEETEDMDGSCRLSLLRDKIQAVEKRGVLNAMRPSSVVKQGYLRSKTEEEEELSLPLWIVFGYWDHHTCLYVYHDAQSERANHVKVMMEGRQRNIRCEGVRFKIEGEERWWYCANAKEAEEWHRMIRNTPSRR
ncbi:hypothetical protein PROFUN_01039 [Planoprotostelium fungivorum]|uniref:Uncharacterized protein n=1 Tax=Planoprotostelium fungivorum TaxID=1890364 RepID=A0A2P6N4I1_9EUKA|nr:hypothetical protein PROFUN_01039 [Planoprotostelium fungivorum]